MNLGLGGSKKAHYLAVEKARASLEWLRSFAESLGLGSILAFVAGIVNSVGILAFGTFVSHISGHATRSAMEYSSGQRFVALIFLAEIACFIAGAITTTVLLHGQTAVSRKVRLSIPLMIEALLITFAVLARHFLPERLLAPGVVIYPFSTLSLTFAMGMQNAMFRHVSGVLVRTTHMTGVATDMGIAFGSAISAVMLKWRQGSGGFFKKFQSCRLAFVDTFRAGRFFFHFSLFTSFTLGAVVGTKGYFSLGFGVLSIPILILGLISIREILAGR